MSAALRAPEDATPSTAEGEALQQFAGKLDVTEESASVMKMRFVAPSGKRVTLMTLDKSDPSSKEAWELIQELDKGGGEIDMSHIVSSMKEKQGLSKTVGRQRMIIAVVLVFSIALFGVTLGTSVLGGSLIKDTHVEKESTLMAGDHVVQTAEAVQSVPLKYLPFMDVSMLASIMGKSIMYTLDGGYNGSTDTSGCSRRVVYSRVLEVSKPGNETLYEAYIRTTTASIILKPAEATLLVDGKEMELCGEVSCSKVSMTMDADLHAVMEKKLGEHAARRLSATCAICEHQKALTEKEMAECEVRGTKRWCELTANCKWDASSSSKCKTTKCEDFAKDPLKCNRHPDCAYCGHPHEYGACYELKAYGGCACRFRSNANCNADGLGSCQWWADAGHVFGGWCY